MFLIIIMTQNLPLHFGMQPSVSPAPPHSPTKRKIQIKLSTAQILIIWTVSVIKIEMAHVKIWTELTCSGRV